MFTWQVTVDGAKIMSWQMGLNNFWPLHIYRLTILRFIYILQNLFIYNFSMFSIEKSRPTQQRANFYDSIGSSSNPLIAQSQRNSPASEVCNSIFIVRH